MILVFGKTGQVAREFQTIRNAFTLDRDAANLSDPMACSDEIRKLLPSAVINTAAYTAVDKAEGEEALATVINGEAPTAMAEACAELGIPFVHISTDYVFEGTGSKPLKPTDQVLPRSAYGRSKLVGEIGIRKSGVSHAILRTSWAFSAHGKNFLNTMLRLSETQDELRVVDDQIGGPTPTVDIALACMEIADQLVQSPSKSGTYHFSGAPDVSWASFASEIFNQSGRTVTVKRTMTHDYFTPAIRPLNSRLDCVSTKNVFGISRPDWRTGLNKVLRDLEDK